MNDGITIGKDPSKGGVPYGCRLLILEDQTRGEIYNLLKKRFPSQLSFERVSNVEALCDAVGKNKYQMLICHLDGSAPAILEQQSTFDLLSKHSPDTYTIVVADQEPEPPDNARQGAFYQYVPSPLDPERLADLVHDYLCKCFGGPGLEGEQPHASRHHRPRPVCSDSASCVCLQEHGMVDRLAAVFASRVQRVLHGRHNGHGHCRWLDAPVRAEGHHGGRSPARRGR